MIELLNDVISNATVQNALALVLVAVAVSVGTWVIAQLSPGTVRKLREANEVRAGNDTIIIEAINESTDYIPTLLGDSLPFTPEQYALALPKIYRALADVMDEVLADRAPDG